MHALIIEDEFFIAWTLEDALKLYGYTSFDLVTGAAAAINAAVERCPDLIVADYNLIDGTGVEAVREICRHREVAVVFVTANEDLVRVQMPSAQVVPKPFRAGGLENAINCAREAPIGPGA